MKKMLLSAIFIIVALLFLIACHSHDHSHDAHGGHSHGTEDEIASLSFTERTRSAELFVEFEPLVINSKTAFAAHYSDMVSFKPFEEGSLSVQLMDGDKVIDRAMVNSPASSGIFRPLLSPSQTGKFDLKFILQSKAITDTILLSDIVVYQNRDKARVNNPIMGDGGDEITYLKEQAWKVDFAIAEARKESIQDVIKVAGEFRALKGEEKMISSKRSGIVTFINSKLQEGRDLRSGETVFAVSSKGLLENNLSAKIDLAKTELDRTKADLNRAETLFADQILSAKEYDKRQADFKMAQSKYSSLTGQGKGTISESLFSPISGIIKSILVSDGQFVNEGEPLMVVSQNRKLQLVADVPQQFQSQLYNIKSANFKPSGSKEVESIDKYKGKLLTVGKSVDMQTGFIPIVFELQNIGNLLPGTFTEVYLKTNRSQDALVIPKSAIMKDYESHYVFVQTGGESFEKREVKLGIDDGEHIQILSGVKQGEWLVSRGAYQIKMASMSNSIPAHGHSH